PPCGKISILSGQRDGGRGGGEAVEAGTGTQAALQQMCVFMKESLRQLQLAFAYFVCPNEHFQCSSEKDLWPTAEKRQGRSNPPTAPMGSERPSSRLVRHSGANPRPAEEEGPAEAAVKERPDDAVEAGLRAACFRRKMKRAEAGAYRSRRKPRRSRRKAAKAAKKRSYGGLEAAAQPQQQMRPSAFSAEPRTSSAGSQPARKPAGSRPAESAKAGWSELAARKGLRHSRTRMSVEKNGRETQRNENAAEERQDDSFRTATPFAETRAESENQLTRRGRERQFQQASVDIGGGRARRAGADKLHRYRSLQRAAVCSLESGAVLACNPLTSRPPCSRWPPCARTSTAAPACPRPASEWQHGVQPAGRGRHQGHSAAVSDESRGQTLLVCKTKTALLAAACQGAPDRAASTWLGDMRQHFISQG
uniref:MID_MedPIWI domain-containing protein n=1 Tax=Macrostomum lignano TaxID=282301 RepID=A0A1I8F4A5_9PLAT